MSDGQPNNPYTTKQTPDLFQFWNQVHITKNNAVDFSFVKYPLRNSTYTASKPNFSKVEYDEVVCNHWETAL
jgi:hypothetical protein